MNRIFLLLFLLFLSNQLHSQIDNNFWFVAPEVSSNHGDRPIYIRISTMTESANIQLRMPANPSFLAINQTILPNSSLTLNLTPWIDSIENKPPDKVLNRGLYLTSDKNITAYYEVANTDNPAVSSFKGKNALGTEFYISGQTTYRNYPNDGSEAFDIVASEDNTHVTITPKIDISGHLAGVSFEVILNRGQTYSARALSTLAPNSLAGSHVVSDKPVAITIFDDSIQTGGWDEIADQTIPVNILGWDYIVIKGFADNTAGNNCEHVYILATKNNTSIYLNGSPTPIVTLSQGSQYDYPIPPADNTVKIKATNPVYVYHLSGNSGEAGSAIIPQDSCTGSRQIGFTRSTSNQFALLILTRAGIQGSFQLNGSSTVITASDFNVVPGTGNDWVYYRKNLLTTTQVTVGSNQITNSSGKFHLGILNMGAAGNSSEYGYFSDFSSLYLGADKSICPGDSLTLDGGSDRSSYDWKRLISGTWVTINSSRFLVIRDSGYYAVMTNGDFCELRDTIHIALYPKPDLNLGNDTTLCVGTSITLDAGNFSGYHWQNGSAGRFFTAAAAGTYWVEVTNNNGCRASDTIVIAMDSLPIAMGAIAGLTPVCQGQNGITYSVAPFPYVVTYSWTLPAGFMGTSTTNSIIVNCGLTAVSDTIRVKGHNHCGFGPALKKPITVSPLPGPAGAISGPASICAGQSGSVYSVLPINNATSYQWSFPAGVTIVLGNGTNSVTVNASLSAISGNITVKGNNTCGNGNSSSFFLTINPLPVPTINGPANVCLNATSSYTTQTGMTGYTWTVTSGGTLQSGSGTSTITVLWTTSGSKTITVNYTNSQYCTGSSPSSKTVIVSTLPAPSLTGLDNICKGATVTYFTDPLKSNYSWFVSPGGTIVAGGTSTDATITVTWNNSGSETVEVNYTSGSGCPGAAPAILPVTVNPFPDPANTIAGPGSICAGQTGSTYSVLPITNATSYLWSFPPGITIVSGMGTNSVVVDASLSAVNGTITVTGNNSCGNGLSTSFPLMINPLPVPSVNGPADVCLNKTGIYSTEPGMTGYAWSVPTGGIIQSGAGTSTIVILWTTTGLNTISVNYTNPNNCSATSPSSKTINITSLPVPSLTGADIICKDTPITYSTDAGMSNYTWMISPGGTINAGGTTNDNTILVTWNNPGPEAVRVNYTAGTGCNAAAPSVLNITIKPSPVMVNAGIPSVCSGISTNIPLQSNPPGSVYSWTASGSSANVSGFSNSAGQDISQTLTNTGFATETVTYNVTPVLNGCTGNPSDVQVSVFPVADVYFTPNGQSICSGLSTGIALNSHVTWASFAWTAAGSSGNVNGFGPGNGLSIGQALNNTGNFVESVSYFVTPSFNLCPGTPDMVMVTINPLPVVSFASCNDPVTSTAAVPFTLKGGVPSGGAYSGTGIVSGIFYPNVAGPGTFAQNYSYSNTWGCSSTSSHSITVIAATPFTCGKILSDPRDNHTYPTVKLGTQCWMAANLDYGSSIPSILIPRDNCSPEKYCFNDNLSSCSSYGGLYTWDELMQYEDTPAMQGLCPPGWHVPFENEWNTLFNLYISSGFAGSPLKYTGYSGFNALLDGLRFRYRVWGMDNFATFFWSSSSHGTEKAWAHSMNSFDPSVSFYTASRSNAFAVRCIKD